jgi:hypothetical protein
MRRKTTYDPARDYYFILGIDSNATSEEIQQAYRRSVRQVHPDLNQDRADWATGQIQLVNEAYGVLRHAARRRQYDRQRWLHVPDQPGRERPSHSPFDEPDYDFNRPWWDQVAERAPRDYPFTAGPMPSRATPPEQRQPFWMTVAAWMKGHRLGALESVWLTLVGLWRSPYAGVLVVLAVALGINVAAIIYVAGTPQRWAGLDEWLASHSGAAEGVESTSTLEQLTLVCDDPAVQIKIPLEGDVVGDTFPIYGTVRHAAMWNYSIVVGFAGPTASVITLPETWMVVRQPPLNQSVPEPPVEDGLLSDEPVDLTGQPAGFYVIRLRAMLRSGQDLQLCDVLVRR